jgi:tRNA pseudouridine55 synthase
LRRTRAGAFAIADSVTMATLEALKANDRLAEMDALLLPADSAVDDLPLVRLSVSGGFYIRQGQPVLVPNAPCDGMVRVALETGEFLGVGEILDDGRVAPRRLIVTGR